MKSRYRGHVGIKTGGGGFLQERMLMDITRQLRDRWAEDKEVWVGRFHLCSHIIQKTKTRGGLHITLRGVPDSHEFGIRLPLLNWSRTDRSSQLLKFILVRATVSRNLKEEAKDEPAPGVGYEVIDLFAQK